MNFTQVIMYPAHQNNILPKWDFEIVMLLQLCK